MFWTAELIEVPRCTRNGVTDRTEQLQGNHVLGQDVRHADAGIESSLEDVGRRIFQANLNRDVGIFFAEAGNDLLEEIRIDHLWCIQPQATRRLLGKTSRILHRSKDLLQRRSRLA